MVVMRAGSGDVEVDVDGNIVLLVAAWLTALGRCIVGTFKLDGLIHTSNEEKRDRG